MIIKTPRHFLLQIVSIAILSSGFAPASFAGTIDTGYLLDADSRSASIDRIEVLLAQENIAEQLQKFGVGQAEVAERLANMTSAELTALEGQLQERIAGGGIVGIVGAVFVVLIILELVGVTDVFKAF